MTPPEPPSFTEMMETVAARGGKEAVALHRDGFVVMPFGDDGETIVAVGHVNKRKFVRQAREWIDATPDDMDWVTVDMVDHVWAIELDPDKPADERRWTWKNITEQTAGAFPITVVET